MLTQSLEPLLKAFAAIFTAAMMFSASLATPDRAIRRASEHRMLLARAFLANVVIVPALAIALKQALQIEGDIAIGAVLAAICPGAPFGTFLAGKSRQDVGLAVFLTCALTLIGLLSVPVTSRLIFGPGKMAALPRGFGAVLVGVLILLPVALGRAIHRRSAEFAGRLAKASSLLTFLALLGATLAASGLRSKGVGLAGWRDSALILTFVAVSVGIGWLSGTSPSTRATLATSTGLRNVGLAYLYAEYSFPDTQAALGVAAYSALMLLPNFVFAVVTRYRETRGARAG